MADLSLDEIIAAKGRNFRVQFQNQNAQKKRFQGKAANQAGQGQSSRQGFHLGKPRFPGNQIKRAFSAPAQQLKDEANGTGSLLLGPGKGQIDARDMISIKSRIKISDARTKILLKRLQKGSLDARAKLQTKPMMAAKMGAIMAQQGPPQQHQQLLQPNTFSQQPLQYQPQQFQQPLQVQFQQSSAPFQQAAPNFRQQKPQFQKPPHFQQSPLFQQSLRFQQKNSGFHHPLPIQQPTMHLDSKNTVDFTMSVNQSLDGEEPVLTRTLRNPLAGGGTLVEDTGDSLKITRSIPDVTFEGNRLTVTRRLPQNHEQNVQPYDESEQRQSSSINQVPVIQIRNDKFKMPHAQGSESDAAKIRVAKPSPSVPVRSPIQVSSSAISHASASGSVRPAVQAAVQSSSSGVISSNRYSYRSATAVTKSVEVVPGTQSRLKPPPVSAHKVTTQSVSVRMQQSGQALSRSKAGDTSMTAKTLSSRPPVTKRLAPAPSQSLSVTDRIKPPLQGQPSASKAGIKRSAPMSLSERFSSSVAGSPIPVITDHAPEKKRRQAVPQPVHSLEEELGEDFELREQFVDDNEEDIENPAATVLSPLQGYRVLVSNLHSSVTQEDIIELFGAIGPLKRANLLQRGQAEVAFIHKEHAAIAMKKYHNRELDGQPMFVKVVTPLNAKVLKIPAAEESSATVLPASLRASKKPAETSVPLEIPLIHKALFKTGSPSTSKSVRFTVKI